MSLFTILIILTVFASLLLTIITVYLVFAYNHKYRLPESKYTRLFGLITKEEVAIIYILFALAHASLSIWFLLTL